MAAFAGPLHPAFLPWGRIRTRHVRGKVEAHEDGYRSFRRRAPSAPALSRGCCAIAQVLRTGGNAEASGRNPRVQGAPKCARASSRARRPRPRIREWRSRGTRPSVQPMRHRRLTEPRGVRRGMEPETSPALRPALMTTPFRSFLPLVASVASLARTRKAERTRIGSGCNRWVHTVTGPRTDSSSDQPWREREPTQALRRNVRLACSHLRWRRSRALVSPGSFARPDLEKPFLDDLEAWGNRAHIGLPPAAWN